MPVAPGAADVDRGLGRGDGNEPRPQGPRRARDLVRRLAARGEGNEEVCDLVFRRRAIEQRAERRFGLGLGEGGGDVGEGGHAVSLAGRTGSNPHTAKKLASRAWPCSVAMLSGWNCTEWIGSVAWRKPITEG